MDSIELFISPFLAGISTGVYCFTYCVPFIAPFIVSEEGNKKRDILIILKFIAGRLAGYLVFGALVGYVGEKVYGGENYGGIIDLVFFASLAALSVLLILHAFGLIRANKSSFCARVVGFNPKFPLIMGFLMGVNVCPPFLMSLTYVFTLHSVVKGVVYFALFFIGTSFYFIPLFFLGYLNRMKEFRLAGRIAAIAVGTLFLFYCVYSLAK